MSKLTRSMFMLISNNQPKPNLTERKPKLDSRTSYGRRGLKPKRKREKNAHIMGFKIAKQSTNKSTTGIWCTYNSPESQYR